MCRFCCRPWANGRRNVYNCLSLFLKLIWVFNAMSITSPFDFCISLWSGIVFVSQCVSHLAFYPLRECQINNPPNVFDSVFHCLMAHRARECACEKQTSRRVVSDAAHRVFVPGIKCILTITQGNRTVLLFGTINISHARNNLLWDVSACVTRDVFTSTRDLLYVDYQVYSLSPNDVGIWVKQSMLRFWNKMKTFLCCNTPPANYPISCAQLIPLADADIELGAF